MFNLFLALVLTILLLYRYYRGDIVSTGYVSFTIGFIVVNLVIFAQKWRAKEKNA